MFSEGNKHGMEGRGAYGNIELVASEITAGVDGLDDHLLAGNRATGEGQFVAGTAPAARVTTGDVDGGKAV